MPHTLGRAAPHRPLSTLTHEGVTDSPVVKEITEGQKRQIFIAAGVPFIAFGFMDNFVMIVAGDLIDGTLCVTFCFSTMAAAAIGNTLSDIIGIYCGSIIENVADRWGIREPPLTAEQRLLRPAKFWQYFGQIVGIVCGCTLGSCPLLFIDNKEADRLKRRKELKEMLDDSMPDIKRIMNVEAVVLVKIGDDKVELQGLSHTANLPELKPWKMVDAEGRYQGVTGYVAASGRFVNVPNIRRTKFYVPEIHDDFQGSGMRIESLLCMPILRGNAVVGLLIAYNKQGGASFSDKDEDTFSFIASHIAVRMESVEDVQQSFQEVVLTCEKVLDKQESVEYSRTAAQRRAELYLPAIDSVRTCLQAQAAALMLVNANHDELYTEAIAGNIPKHGTKIGEGIAGRCAEQGRIINMVQGSAQWTGDFDKQRHTDYLGTGVDIHSELCVPMFTSSRKCIGVLKFLNKQGCAAFNEDDINFAVEAASKLEIMLEDDGGIKRVLQISRQHQQKHAAVAGLTIDHHTVICTVDSGQSLPDKSSLQRACRLDTPAGVDGINWRLGQDRSIDPYLVMSIVRGNPLDRPDLEKETLNDRQRDRTEVVRRFSRTQVVRQDLNPKWDETLAVTTPFTLRDVPDGDLFLHVTLWSYHATKDDELIAQAAVCLEDITRSTTKRAKPVQLLPVPDSDAYNLESSKLWLSISRGAKPLANRLVPPFSAKNKEDWAGDNFVPKVGSTDEFQSNEDWLTIVNSVRQSLTSSCGVSFEEIERLKQEQGGGGVICAVSDPTQDDCPLVYVSKGFEELTEYPRSYAIGRNCRFLQPKDRMENDEKNLYDRRRMQYFVQGMMPDDYVLWNVLLNETLTGQKFWNVLRMQFVHVGPERKPYIFAVQRRFAKAPRDLDEVKVMREKLGEHEAKGTLPLDVLAWAGLSSSSERSF